MEEYTKGLERMQMIDTLRYGQKFYEADLVNLTQGNIPSAIFRSVDNTGG